MDELFESFDAWLEDVGQEILDEENKPMLLNPARLTQMQFVYIGHLDLFPKHNDL